MTELPKLYESDLTEDHTIRQSMVNGEYEGRDFNFYIPETAAMCLNKGDYIYFLHEPEDSEIHIEAELTVNYKWYDVFSKKWVIDCN